ncbi:hypothetical protein ACLRDC_17100 [Gluconacetobacter sacchari]|uniref:hypothetical protein n=2 Tax=Gluconacetobacter sacchari TaxID=92759 RepID=UPI0039B4F4C4
MLMDECFQDFMFCRCLRSRHVQAHGYAPCRFATPERIARWGIARRARYCPAWSDGNPKTTIPLKGAMRSPFGVGRKSVATIHEQVQRLRSDLETLGTDLLQADEALRSEFKSWGAKSGAKALRKTAKRLQDLGDVAVTQANDLNTKILEKVGDSKERAQQVSTLLGETASRLERGDLMVASGGVSRKLVGVICGVAAFLTVVTLIKKMRRKR